MPCKQLISTTTWEEIFWYNKPHFHQNYFQVLPYIDWLPSAVWNSTKISDTYVSTSRFLPLPNPLGSYSSSDIAYNVIIGLSFSILRQNIECYLVRFQHSDQRKANSADLRDHFHVTNSAWRIHYKNLVFICNSLISKEWLLITELWMIFSKSPP